MPLENNIALENLSPIEDTSAEPGIAKAIKAALDARSITTKIVETPSSKARTIILTEGLSSADPTERHWAALRQARTVRESAASIIFLQARTAQSYADISGLTGLSRTLRKEWSDGAYVTWTLTGTQPDALAEQVCACLSHFPGDALITDTAYQATQTGNLLASPAIKQATSPQVWLITGGARGVTASCAIELAQRCGGTFLLAGRSSQAPWPAGIPLTDDLNTLRGALARQAKIESTKTTPAEINTQARRALAGQEITSTITAIEAAGGRVEYLQLDVADDVAVKTVIGDIQTVHGVITGLVHGAGVLADRLVIDKTRTDMGKVFDAKVTGLLNLLEHLDLAQLSYIGLFSSASAVFGNIGQSNYAMANQILNRVAVSLAGNYPRTQVKSFNWGPWDGGMVDAGLAAHFAAQGIGLIDRAEGAHIFADQLLHGERSQIELLVGDQWTDT